ncbi:galactose-1-phosphate uridylyltransferase [Patescibacteria group bacterium]|nr:galactose-1-phosphate uridylyltransferase [Patescibacteria group bacterium]MBU1673687.1 galactose-1-phosphate uridylyltransferase [Patescibacteria group bacterium]MBU1963497.1 galactose-1-phosphate uridylyltransferase [Patescibacteria group bacterium]
MPKKQSPLKKGQPEIRENYIHDRFVIIAPGRSKRPDQTKKLECKKAPEQDKSCVFCPANIDKQKYIYKIGSKPWDVKVVPNKFPIVSKKFDEAYGVHEVVIETPKHGKEISDLPPAQIEKVLQAYQHRTREISKDPKIKYIFIFKNQGGRAGASIDHAHSQIFATSFLTPHIIKRLTRAKEYEVTHGKCYYCELAEKEGKKTSPLNIYSDQHFSVFAPYASTYNYEAWVIPHRHIDNITTMTPAELKSFAKIIKCLTQSIDDLDIAYNFYFHQAVTDSDEHFYFRLCPRKAVQAGIELGSRLIVNAVPPEEAAKYYREGIKAIC